MLPQISTHQKNYLRLKNLCFKEKTPMEDFSKATAEIAQNRDKVIEKLVQFSLTDTMVFWSTEKDLMEAQQKVWGPILKWANDGLKTQIQSTQSLEVPIVNLESGYRVRNFLHKLNDKELTVFYKAALLMKSVILAMAFVHREIDANQAFEAALLEEIWQNKAWGTTDDVEENQDQFKKELFEMEKILNS